jgi:hypothetical protein
VPEEPSIIERSERVFDDVSRLWRRRPWLCIGILIALLSPSLVLLADKFWGRSKLQEEISDFKSAETKRDRDSKATQLAPFLAAANQHFASEPPDKRLDLFLERTQSLTQLLTEVVSRLPESKWRALSLEAQSRIKEKLNLAPHVGVGIIVSTDEAEALALGQQLKVTFEGAGFNSVGVSKGRFSTDIRGLVVMCKQPPDGPLLNALIQLFLELGVPPRIYGGPALISTASPIDVYIEVGQAVHLNAAN